MNDERFRFTATEAATATIPVPYVEDAKADFAPYYSSAGHGKRIVDAKEEVVIELAKLGAGGVMFTEGFFGDNPRRYGYLVQFSYLGGTGRMEVAGLPIKLDANDKKVLQVRVQALLNVRDWLKSSITAQVFSPGSYPLMQYLLVNEHQTLAEAALEARGMPNMNPRLPSGE